LGKHFTLKEIPSNGPFHDNCYVQIKYILIKQLYNAVILQKLGYFTCINADHYFV